MHKDCHLAQELTALSGITILWDAIAGIPHRYAAFRVGSSHGGVCALLVEGLLACLTTITILCHVTQTVLRQHIT